MPELVLVEELDGYAICTLNLEHKRNPISAPMRNALVAALKNLAQNDNVRSVILTGAGSAFCSGLDLEALAAQAQWTQRQHLADSRAIDRFFKYVASYPKPTIAAVNGPAVAGGAGLAVVCDITLASSEASFGFSEVKIGFVPAIVSVYLIDCISPKKCRELLMTGRKIDAHEAFCMGLANAVHPPQDLKLKAVEMAQLFAKNGPEAVRETKRLLHNVRTYNHKQALNLAVRSNARVRASKECREGVRAFLEKRPPNWK